MWSDVLNSVVAKPPHIILLRKFCSLIVTRKPTLFTFASLGHISDHIVEDNKEFNSKLSIWFSSLFAVTNSM